MPAMTTHSGPSPEAIHSSRPLRFLHPTTRYHPITITRQQHPQQQRTTQDQHISRPRDVSLPKPTAPEQNQAASQQIFHVWRSRDNRKGRHRAVITGQDAKKQLPRVTREKRHPRLRKKVLGLARLVTRFPVWDVSYLVAVTFVLGSVIWCVNGCFVWLPLVAPASEFPGETDVAGILAFVGATVFEFGSVLLVIEAVNAERSDCFGWALEESLEDHGLSLRPRHEGCHHHHRDRGALIGKSAVASMAATTVDDLAEPGALEERKSGDGKIKPEKERRWSWWPTWHEFRTHYIKEIGFLASFIQLLGATIFWISGFTALPPIYNNLSIPVMNGVYWVPQVVGGTGFIISGFLFMVEVQDKWYKPALKTLGWHVGFWNLLGGIGFTLCPAVGFGSEFSSALEYASALSTFIGSWTFLIGSVAQWYESLDKYPVSVEKSPSWLATGEKAV